MEPPFLLGIPPELVLLEYVWSQIIFIDKIWYSNIQDASDFMVFSWCILRLLEKVKIGSYHHKNKLFWYFWSIYKYWYCILLYNYIYKLYKYDILTIYDW